MKSPLSGWIGGKSRLAREVCARLPEHTCYAEPFAGAAWVLFHKEESAAEALNDINGELVNLYRVVRAHLDEFIRCARYLLCSREEFERFKLARPETMTDVHRAVRFYFIQKLCFGGKLQAPTFGYSTTRPPRLNLLRIEEELSSAHIRLARVLIEHLAYGEFIRRYDKPHTCFYVDPPYWGAEDYYGKGLFNRDDFAALARQLAGIQGKFLLSINDTPEIRGLFKGFEIATVQTQYSCANGSNKGVTELLVKNY